MEPLEPSSTFSIALHYPEDAEAKRLRWNFKTFAKMQEKFDALNKLSVQPVSRWKMSFIATRRDSVRNFIEDLSAPHLIHRALAWKTDRYVLKTLFAAYCLTLDVLSLAPRIACTAISLLRKTKHAELYWEIHNLIYADPMIDPKPILKSGIVTFKLKGEETVLVDGKSHRKKVSGYFSLAVKPLPYQVVQPFFTYTKNIDIVRLIDGGELSCLNTTSISDFNLSHWPN